VTQAWHYRACLLLCIYSYICWYIYMHTYMCKGTHAHTHTHVRTRTNTNTHTHAHAHAHTHARTHARTHTHTHTHTHAHTHTHTHTHARTHTHAHMYDGGAFLHLELRDCLLRVPVRLGLQSTQSFRLWPFGSSVPSQLLHLCSGHAKLKTLLRVVLPHSLHRVHSDAECPDALHLLQTRNLHLLLFCRCPASLMASLHRMQ
jgi:hypothetical protein